MDSMEVDDDIYLNKSLTMEGLITQVDVQRRKQPCRHVTVCLGLLCVVLLAGNIGQIIYYGILTHPSSANSIQASYNTLTQERDHLQNDNDTLTTERDQLQSNCDSLTAEKEHLEAKRDKDQLQRSYNTLSTSKDHLQISYSSLWKDKEQLQSRYNALWRVKEWLQTNYSSLAAERERLQNKTDKLTVKVRGKPCQTGWRKFDISCYFISTIKRNWTVSRKDCIARGADLVIIDSRDEQVFVNGLLGVSQNAWIGLTDSLQEGTWTWVDGTPLTMDFWQPRQPNNFSGNQDCGEIVQKPSVGEWNDDGCFAEQLWICEK
ncbi:C-type lectin domain family 4 member M-like isoform X2 [Toxotes jaculatrix]|uniref:C-type lectin domain family 4 member M-like isoform X2 n=1 Tax=Toxotes jaculatrix TaxID=941984 RepID=UPI001B3AAE83|nr:C-type lectin domain family 4 member M-like isoform X2 [Toxotes jaculatrix]